MVRSIYLLVFGFISCTCFVNGFSQFKKAPGLEGRQCVDKLFSISYNTLIKCAVFCVSSSECERFHFWPGYNTCVGCSASSGLQTPPAVASDTMVFVLGGQRTYIGCYQDNQNRILSEPYLVGGTVTNAVCSELCRDQGFIYSGTQNGRECMCGNNFSEDQKLLDSECTKKCYGDQAQICGGRWKISIYT